MALVDVVHTIREPNPAVTAESLNRIDRFACALGFHAFRGHLPTAFISDRLAVLESQAVIVSQLEDRANVNHVGISLPLS